MKAAERNCVMMSNILIVDDEKEIADLVEVYLKNENYTVFKYYSSKEVIHDLENLSIDLAILDVMMPEIDGFQLCQEIRKLNYTFPVIFATAKVEALDKINGLTIGADDYVTKPFQPLELIARVKAQLRRCQHYNQPPKTENSIDFRGIQINKEAHEFFLNEKKINLTKTEFLILWLLCENRGTLLKTETLFEQVWGEQYFEKDNNTIMVHIRHLREKMNDTGKQPKYIKTVYGMGYKIEK